MYVYIAWCVVGLVIGLMASRKRGVFRVEPALNLAFALFVFALFRFGLTGVNSSIFLGAVLLAPIGVIYFLRLASDRAREEDE